MEIIYRRCPRRPDLELRNLFFEGARARSRYCKRQLHQDHHNQPGSICSTYAFSRSASSSSAKSSLDAARTFPRSSQPAERRLAALEEKAKQVLQNPELPSEESCQSILQSCEEFARLFTSVGPISGSSSTAGGQSAISSLLSVIDEKKGLGGGAVSQAHVQYIPSFRNKIAKQVSALADGIIMDSRVFITAAMLAFYVSTQALLGFHKPIPQAFVLYAQKPLPRPGISPSQYRAPNPNKASAAIPLPIAIAGLNVAIENRDLPVCLDIINTSVGTQAFRRAKFVRRALLPIVGFALAPAAAYALASQVSTFQNTMDPSTARNIAFAGLITYISCTGTIGYVALTTANDQMDRVTWAQGMPLWERWAREDERLLIDNVAGAWGFKEPSRKGEEEGKDWEMLREWIGLKGMVLDKVALMEGME